MQIVLKPPLKSQWYKIRKMTFMEFLHFCLNLNLWPVIKVYSFLFVAYFVQTSGSYGLVWIFNDTLRETTCLLLVKFSDILGILKFYQSFGRHLAVHLQTTCLVSLLQRTFTKLPLDGREIYENTLIIMMTSTLKPFRDIRNYPRVSQYKTKK